MTDAILTEDTVTVVTSVLAARSVRLALGSCYLTHYRSLLELYEDIDRLSPVKSPYSFKRGPGVDIGRPS